MYVEYAGEREDVKRRVRISFESLIIIGKFYFVLSVYTACVTVTLINYRFMERIYLRCESKLVSSKSKLVFMKCNNILLP